jgi:hypothetical protein
MPIQCSSNTGLWRSGTAHRRPPSCERMRSQILTFKTPAPGFAILDGFPVRCAYIPCSLSEFPCSGFDVSLPRCLRFQGSLACFERLLRLRQITFPAEFPVCREWDFWALTARPRSPCRRSAVRRGRPARHCRRVSSRRASSPRSPRAVHRSPPRFPPSASSRRSRPGA